MSAIDGLFLESGSGGIAITAKFEKKMSFLQIECLGTANRQPTMGLDELPCLGLQSHSRHAHATLFARSWPVCRDGGIGRRSGLKIRRGQPLASSSLAPGTKLNQGFVKMAQGRSQTLFCVFFCTIFHHTSPRAKGGSTPKTGASPFNGQIFRQVSDQFPSHFSSTKRAPAGGNFRSYESHTLAAGSTSFFGEILL